MSEHVGKTLESVLKNVATAGQEFAKIESNEKGVLLVIGEFVFVVKDNTVYPFQTPAKP